VKEIPQVLLVDDSFAKRVALKAVLAPLGLPVVEAESGLAALRCVMAQDFAVILLDVRMPTMDGFETAARIRQRKQSEMTPIIFVTAFGAGENRRADHYSEGAVDFIVAPVDPDELRAKVTVFANLFVRAAQLASDATAVESSANQLRLLTDVAPIGIFQTDASNRYVYTNPRWSEITGITAEDALGQPWEQVIDSGRWTPTLTELSEASEVSEPNLELARHFEIPGPNGPPRIVFVNAASIPDPDGDRAGWVGTVADVTAEANAEAAALHFRAVVESSHDAIISKDLSGIITSWNGGAKRLFGYSAEDAIGMSIAMIMPPGHDDEPIEVLNRAPFGELADDYETMRMRKDSSLVDVALMASPILGPHMGVVGTSIIARDISDRRRNEQLKDEFLALVSHELRTPLSSIVAHIELLLDDSLTDAQLRRQFTEVIDRNSVRLERLVGDLLFVAQLESADLTLSMTTVDIVAVAADAIEAAVPRALQQGVDVVLVVTQRVAPLIGDPGRLGQAIDNLVSNAIKYSPEGGEVSVRIESTTEECTIEIADHGIGIGLDEQIHLFDRFFRASAAVNLHIQGVGLGLSIVKRIVDGHGGQVSVSSEPGVGATFRMALPVSQSSPRWETALEEATNAQGVA
jgi:PAS domain S-box-containing protein